MSTSVKEKKNKEWNVWWLSCHKTMLKTLSMKLFGRFVAIFQRTNRTTLNICFFSHDCLPLPVDRHAVYLKQTHNWASCANVMLMLASIWLTSEHKFCSNTRRHSIEQYSMACILYPLRGAEMTLHPSYAALKWPRQQHKGHSIESKEWPKKMFTSLSFYLIVYCIRISKAQYNMERCFFFFIKYTHINILGVGQVQQINGISIHIIGERRF